MKLPLVDGKEVVPVRFIPFITHGEWGRKVIADILAHELKVCDAESLAKHHTETVAAMAAERRGIASFDDILSGDYEEESGDILEWVEPYAYRLDDEGKAEIVPVDEWRTVCAKIRPIIELAHQKEDRIGVEGAKRQKWHKATLKVIPDDAFMWKADLEKMFPAKKLNYNVGLDDKCRPLVQAAFDRLNKVATEHATIIKFFNIGGREVIPVRLLPLITEPEITPLQLVECLWNPRGDLLKHLNHYPFCRDWSLLHKEMKAIASGGIREQLEQFHGGMYVARSDFEEHEYITSKAICLKLDKALPAPLLTLAYEGFSPDAAVIPQPGKQQAPPEDPVLELRRMIAESKPSPPAIPFDTTHTEKQYCVPEGSEPVRLAGGAGHVITIDGTPSHIMMGFVREALERGCIAVEQTGAEQAETSVEKPPKKDKREPPSTKGSRDAWRTCIDAALHKYHTEKGKEPNSIRILFNGMEPGTSNEEGDTEYCIVSAGKDVERYLVLTTKKGEEYRSFKQINRIYLERKREKFYLTLKSPSAETLP